MRRLFAVLCSLLLTAQMFAGGAIDFDGDDYYSCPNITLGDPAGTSNDDRVSLMAFVTPDFASTDTSVKVIVSQAEIVSCPGGLPPQCGAPQLLCGEGYSITWNGGSTRFEFRLAESDRCGMGVTTLNWCFTGSVTFAAGDLIGLYGWFNDFVQQCEALIPAGSSSAGSTFNPHTGTAMYNGETMHIGASNPSYLCGGSGACNYWEGAIDMLILGNGRVLNADNNRLIDVHKRSWKPMWQGTFADSGFTGTSPFEPVFQSDMMDGAIGATVSTLNSGSPSCSATGDPTSTTTRMMY